MIALIIFGWAVLLVLGIALVVSSVGWWMFTKAWGGQMAGHGEGFLVIVVGCTGLALLRFCFLHSPFYLIHLHVFF